jgi:hypothetical protein
VKERQRASLKKGDRKPVPVQLPERGGDARDLAGKAVGVSGTLVDRANAHAHRRYDRTSDGLEVVGGTDAAGSSIDGLARDEPSLRS